MGNLGAVSQGDLALGSCIVTAGTPAWGVQRGFADAITDNGVGDYSLTMSNAQALATAGVVHATIQGASTGEIAVEVVSATVLRVRIKDNAGMALDSSFWIRVIPVSPT